MGWSIAWLGVAWAAPDGASGSSQELADAATATPRQMQAFAAEKARQVGAHLALVTKLTDEARAQSDADLLACLIPKKTALAALQQVVLKSNGAILKATADFSGSNEKVARYHYRLIAVAGGRALGQRQAAERCDSRSTSVGAKHQTLVVTGGESEPDDSEFEDPLDGIWLGWDPPPPSIYSPD